MLRLSPKKRYYQPPRIPRFFAFNTKVTISGNLSSREIVSVTLDIFLIDDLPLNFFTLKHLKIGIHDVNQLLFSRDFDVWNRSALTAPARRAGASIVLLLYCDFVQGVAVTVVAYCVRINRKKYDILFSFK